MTRVKTKNISQSEWKIQLRAEWKICLKAKNENITQDQNKNTTQKKKKKTWLRVKKGNTNSWLKKKIYLQENMTLGRNRKYNLRLEREIGLMAKKKNMTENQKRKYDLG